MQRLKTILRSPWMLRARREERRLARTLRHELAVCAIFREEAPFLDEWLRFHEGIGVTQFYLYNNFSTDDFRGVLAPWIARGLVTLHDWPRAVGQFSAYRHCVRRYRREARWIAFIDLDEFLFSPQRQDIRPILARFADRAGVAVNELFFGSAGHDAPPAGPIVEAYTKRAALDFVLRTPFLLKDRAADRNDDASYLPLGCFVKTIANPRLIRAIRSPHAFKYWAGEAVTTDGAPLDGGHAPAMAIDLLRINHYWSRSLADLRTKVARGDASTKTKRDLAWHLDFEARLNAEEDRSIAPIAAAIRAGASGAR